MRISILMLMACSVLAGCNTLRSPEQAPVCDGKHRRTANPYGSVLVDPPSSPSAKVPEAVPVLPCGEGR